MPYVPLRWLAEHGDLPRGVTAEAVAADLDRLERGQQADGGWTVDYASFSPAPGLEWRGHATVSAIAILRANGR